MFPELFAWFRSHERQLSALAMIAGFIFDSFFFGRVDDVWQTHLVFATYAAICFISIPFAHWLEMRAERRNVRSRFVIIFHLATQFALGGFWSGFLIFYGRSAVFGASWPFLLFLVLILIGNEYFKRYHSRLVFTSVLFFFALYSYAIFAVPIYTGSLGVRTFLESGAIAVGAFALFTMLLRRAARERFLGDLWRIRAGAAVVLVLMNIFYFTNILPPLPLSAKAGGIYHGVSRIPGAYLGQAENQSWTVRYLGLPPTQHVTSGAVLYAYSSVFAPAAIATRVTHHWQKYDDAGKRWQTRAKITYEIVGGRDGGYRGYTKAFVYEKGKWRVDVETSDGRVIDRLRFNAEPAEVPPPVVTVTLK